MFISLSKVFKKPSVALRVRLGRCGVERRRSARRRAGWLSMGGFG